MKETKETKETKEKYELNILEIQSLVDAKEFKKVATGRKFCKKGERLFEICREEIEKYNYKNSSFINRILNYYKYNKKTNKLMLETRTTSVIRSLAIYYINNSDEINEEEIINNVTNYILNKIEKFEKSLKPKAA